MKTLKTGIEEKSVISALARATVLTYPDDKKMIDFISEEKID
jgi:hypothetical protein